MARPRLKECSNCQGTNPKCKYKETGRKCRIGKAKGKAKGKAVSKATLDRLDEYDSKLGDLFSEYEWALEEARINNGHKFSFYNFLLAHDKTLASFYRYNYIDKGKALKSDIYFMIKGEESDTEYLERIEAMEQNNVTAMWFLKHAQRDYEKEPLQEIPSYEEKAKEAREALDELKALTEQADFNKYSKQEINEMANMSKY